MKEIETCSPVWRSIKLCEMLYVFQLQTFFFFGDKVALWWQRWHIPALDKRHQVIWEVFQLFYAFTWSPGRRLWPCRGRCWGCALPASPPAPPPAPPPSAWTDGSSPARFAPGFPADAWPGWAPVGRWPQGLCGHQVEASGGAMMSESVTGWRKRREHKTLRIRWVHEKSLMYFCVFELDLNKSSVKVLCAEMCVTWV